MAGIWYYARPEIGSKHCLQKIRLCIINTVMSRQERLSYVKHGSCWSKKYKEYLLDAKRGKRNVLQRQSKHELKVSTNPSRPLRKRTHGVLTTLLH